MSETASSFAVVVIFENRPDGGLRVYSDDVPGFVLSHPDANAVRGDVIPALETLLSEVLERKVRVELRPGQRDDGLRQRPLVPVTKVEKREYVAYYLAA